MAYILSGLILTITNYSGFGIYFAIAIIVAAMATAVMLYALGLRRHLPSASSRLLGVAAGMGISILVTLILMGGYIVQNDLFS